MVVKDVSLKIFKTEIPNLANLSGPLQYFI
jgi:hypothetical protein